MAGEERELRRLIERSQVLDPVLKRAWLGALPLMTSSQRAELRAILAIEHESRSAVDAAGDSVRPAAQ